MFAKDGARNLLKIGSLLDRGGFLFASTTHDNDELQGLSTGPCGRSARWGLAARCW